MPTPSAPDRPLRWPNEPAQGGWYTAAEELALSKAWAESADPVHTGWRAKNYEMRFEDAVAAYCQVPYAVAYNSGGAALEMTLHALDLQPGDEVISCAINFVGTHLAVINQGGRLVLGEPDPLSLNLDPADTKRLLTPRTRAIVLTHWNGQPADVQPFLDLAAAHPHPVHGPPLVIVDAARAMGARTPSAAVVGAEGHATLFSFQAKKPMTTLGLGGMVVTADEALARRLRNLRSYGKGRTWGTCLKMTKAQSAVGLVQLARLDEMNDARIARAHARIAALADIDELTLPPVVHDRRHLYYRFNLLVPETWSVQRRDALIRAMAGRGLGSIVADPPTYRRHALIREHTAGQRCPRADALADRLLCPFLHAQTPQPEEREIQQIIRSATRAVTHQALRSGR